jgi:hexosaminidase
MSEMKYQSICGAVLLILTVLPARGEETSRCVRFAYLVSGDRKPVPEYVKAIEDAARDIRGWYAKQLGGPTFNLTDPIVEVLHSEKPAAWFTTHPNGKDEASWGFYNTLDEMRRLRDVHPIRDNSIWVVYSDGPGNKGRAMPGFAYLPEDDLLGLVGKHPTQEDPVRWVAGMGHELGHTLGLPHPRDTQKHHDALMWAGFYGKYPDRCYLTDEDKAILAKNPFIVASADLSLVPKPHLAKSLEEPPWRLGTAMRLRVPEQIPKANEHFQVVADALEMLANTGMHFVGQSEEADVVVVVDRALAADAYVLRVHADGVQIEASSLQGIAHATATLLQLIGQYRDTVIPAMEIRDEPDCSYRNFMVDLGRNPHSLESLKETIDLLWFYKVDSLQLHLTDDQRFTFPSKAFPKLLTEKGKITWEQFAELERYAQARGIAIIPELEVPGHSGILRQTYPEVFGKTPTDLAQSETARKGIKVLLDEMIELFPSSPYIHIGGDEAAGVPEELQRSLINDLHAYLKSKGKQTVVWEGPSLGEGDNKVNTDVIHLNWETIYFPAERMLAAGYRVVNATWDPLYIVDHYPRNNFTMASPQRIYETLRLTKFQHFNPGMPAFAKPLVTERSDRLIGFCMPWWEGRDENYAAVCFPRVIPMAEIAWNHDSRRDHRDFAARSAATETVRQRTFYPVDIVCNGLAVPEDGVFHDHTQVALEQGDRSGEIRYTLDGSKPNADATLYRKPLTIDQSTIVRAALFTDGEQVSHDSRRSLTCVRPIENLALGKRVTSNRTSGSPFSIGRLTDGGTGALDYYLAYPSEPDPVEITVDLGDATTINRITVFAYFNARAYESYRVLVSRDGEEFSEVGRRLEKPAQPTVFINHDFEPQEVRYIRVESNGCKQNVFESFSRLIEIQAFLIER